MFCSKCGTRLQDDACFCYNCGYAMAQSAPQYNAYQSAPQPAAYQPAAPQPAAGYGNVLVKDGVNVVYPDGHSEIGNLSITATQMVFVKKSKFVRVAFGFLGSSLEEGQEALRINLSDIAYGQKIRYGLNSNVYQITLRDGAVFKLCPDRPKTVSYLQGLFG